jgi:hypothetical protein
VIFIIVLGYLQNDQLSEDKGISPPLLFLSAWCVVFGLIPSYLINAPYLRMEAEAAARRREKDALAGGSEMAEAGEAAAAEKEELA